jgi:transposase
MGTINAIVTFKPCSQQQLMLPTNLNDVIPEKHLVRTVNEVVDVRTVNEVVDELDLKPLLRQYKGGGTSSYHPRMMLKVLVYAYTQRTFSSRQIAKALRENINYMWLSGYNKPNFRTINRFRGVVMREVIEEVFTAVLDYLIVGQR